jgi:hypothetical protein
MMSLVFTFADAAMPDIALRGLKPELHRALKEAANRNHRSLNGEILARLEASVDPRPLNLEALLARIEARKTRIDLLDLTEADLRALKDDGRE